MSLSFQEWSQLGILTPPFHGGGFWKAPVRAQGRGPSQTLHTSAAARENLPNTPARAGLWGRRDKLLLVWRSYSTVYSQAFPVNTPSENLWAWKGRPYLWYAPWHPAELGHSVYSIGSWTLSSVILYLQEKHTFLLTLLRSQEKGQWGGKGQKQPHCIK